MLENADTFELISLDHSLDNYDESDHTHFHGWRVLGRIPLREPWQRQQIIAALYDSIARSRRWGGACFNPRHGIHITKDGKALDLVMCFHCRNLNVVGPGGQSHTALINETQPAFDAILRQARVPLDGS